MPDLTITFEWHYSFGITWTDSRGGDIDRKVNVSRRISLSPLRPAVVKCSVRRRCKSVVKPTYKSPSCMESTILQFRRHAQIIRRGWAIGNLDSSEAEREARVGGGSEVEQSSLHRPVVNSVLLLGSSHGQQLELNRSHLE